MHPRRNVEEFAPVEEQRIFTYDGEQQLDGIAVIAHLYSIHRFLVGVAVALLEFGFLENGFIHKWGSGLLRAVIPKQGRRGQP